MQGLGKGGAGGRGVREEEEQERGKEKRNKEEKMRNGLDEELGVLQDGRRTDGAQGCLATSVWLSRSTAVTPTPAFWRLRWAV